MKRFALKLSSAATAIAASSIALAQSVSAQYYTYTYDDPTAVAGIAGLGGVMIVVYCCIICLAILVPIVLAVVVYKDAVKNKVENPILWALLTFFFSIIGVLVYFLAIRPEAIKKNTGKTE